MARGAYNDIVMGVRTMSGSVYNVMGLRTMSWECVQCHGAAQFANNAIPHHNDIVITISAIFNSPAVRHDIVRLLLKNGITLSSILRLSSSRV